MHSRSLLWMIIPLSVGNRNVGGGSDIVIVVRGEMGAGRDRSVFSTSSLMLIVYGLPEMEGVQAITVVAVSFLTPDYCADRMAVMKRFIEGVCEARGKGYLLKDSGQRTIDRNSYREQGQQYSS